MKPEEKMAQRILERHGLEPPFDLEELVSKYASIEKRLFPFSADGISVGIDGVSKPEILINSLNPETRQKFTLAHELGHIIIPWHTGIIVSHTGDIPPSVSWEYREMESEANRFAAELLLPTKWIRKKFSESASISGFLEEVLKDSCASSEAAFIKIFNTLDEKIVLAGIDINGRCIRYYKTKSVPHAETLGKVDLLNEEPFSTASRKDEFYIYDRRYISWVFQNVTFEETDTREWRAVLAQMLSECGADELLSSVNAVLPSVYQRHKDKGFDEICSKVVMAYEGRDKFRCLVEHGLFKQYVFKRVRELVKKTESNHATK